MLAFVQRRWTGFADPSGASRAGWEVTVDDGGTLRVENAQSYVEFVTLSGARTPLLEEVFQAFVVQLLPDLASSTAAVLADVLVEDR